MVPNNDLSTTMEELAGASKEVLVQIVKFIQKQGMRGEHGDWKEFLKFYDKQLGASLSDPAKRSADVLLAFIKTFKKESDLKLFAKVMNCGSNSDTAKQLLKSTKDISPEEPLHIMTNISMVAKNGLSATMEELAGAGKEVLVQIVKFMQKQGMRGENGDWKEFLKFYDKQLGTSLSDPSKRSVDDLLAFIKTFKEESDLKLIAKVMNCGLNRESANQLLKSTKNLSTEESLVRMTIEHPLYPIEYTFPSYQEDWVITKLWQKNKNKLLAVDCEMVLCEDGSEALAKICVVDRELKVKLHEFVNPHKAVADYRTGITGVSAEDLSGATYLLADIQKTMIKLLTHGSILVGHSLSNDLKALKLDHARVIDTCFIFKYGDNSGKIRPSLNALCKTLLGYEVRKKDAPHNCKDDACAAMKLVLAKLENGYDDVIPMVADNVPDSERLKLLIHSIPVSMPSDNLHRIIGGEFTIEVLKSKKGKGEKYSALAIFKTPEEALQTFENIQGDEIRDTGGRPQKPVSVKLSSGQTETMYIRKMTRDTALVSTKKRPCPEEEIPSEPNKVLKTEHAVDVSNRAACLACVEQVEEIKRLKRMVKTRDKELSSLQETFAVFIRKQGL